ncbi:MAG: CDP-diacylglycerol--glycerol-3-phosphate 3-phosphatidyltransferase [Gammaproteobacteria bacterium]|jgi:CDP-diacylglycerol---glycerol-3-phosphate 3-phosphatidyltransferase
MQFTLNLPNLLTLARIVLIPLMVLVFYLPFTWVGPASAAIFALAGFTDWLDGFLARYLKQSSHFGAFLDPVADKLIVAVALILLVDQHRSFFLAIAAMIIIGREITISALREWMAHVGARHRVAVSFVGKVKTAMQMLAIVLLLYQLPLFGYPTYKIGLVALYVAALLTLWSMVQYMIAAMSRDQA